MSVDFLILHGLKSNKLFSSLCLIDKDCSYCALCALASEVYSVRAENNLSALIERLIIEDDNVFSRTCAGLDLPSDYLVNAMAIDLSKIYQQLSYVSKSQLFCVGKLEILSGNPSRDAQLLCDFYKQSGYGQFIYNHAFTYAGGQLTPVVSPSSISLDDLKDYVEEKKIVLSNVENFLLGLPHSNMLLYGERGTGKSSTIHAIVNKLSSQKLRIVEIKKESLDQLASLKAYLATVPMRFIVFIDDLSLPSGDQRISTLKATLEGTLEGNSQNTMIVATSNRRHIVDEKFSVRNDSVHAGDSMQEELSLSDRFGISVLFASTTKPQYLSIVHQLAADYKIKTAPDQLDLLAERWAIAKGGRSPRRAKQFISMLSSAESRGIPLEF